MEKHAYNAGVRYALQTLGLWKSAQTLQAGGPPSTNNLNKIIPAPPLDTRPGPAPQAPLKGRMPTTPPAPQRAI